MSNYNKNGGFTNALKRKLITAVLSSLIFALIFSLNAGLEFEGDGFANLYFLNLMFAITYGVITSLFSDWLSRKIFKRTIAYEIASLMFHCVFGSILLVMSLVSAISFFLTDRLLATMKISWLSVFAALAAVVLVFIFMINK